MRKKVSEHKSASEKSSAWFSKKIKPFKALNETKKIIIEVSSNCVLNDYEQCLGTRQGEKLEGQKNISALNKSINQFFAYLSAELNPRDCIEIFSLLVEALSKCAQEYKKQQDDVLTARERELARIANVRPIFPWPEETQRKIDEYRKKCKNLKGSCSK